MPLALSQANLIGMFYLIYLGLRSLVSSPGRLSPRVHDIIGASMLLVFAVTPFARTWSVNIAFLVAVTIIACTIRLLWTAKTPELRVPLRALAVLLLAILLQFLLRLPLESLLPSSPLLLFLRKTTILLLTTMAFLFLAIYAAESRRRLHEESRLDVLTELPNRRAIEEGAINQVQLATRDGRPCVLLMLDLDHFKKLNDTWGHDLGDRALRAAGKVLLRASGTVGTCTVGRMGGEEFAMLISDCSIAAVHSLAEQLREEIAAIRLDEGEKKVSFTASIGLSALQSGEGSWTEMLRRADVALYRAKREGRNRVVLCSEALQSALGDETSLNAYDRQG